jgi:hypothetical protein
MKKIIWVLFLGIALTSLSAWNSKSIKPESRLTDYLGAEKVALLMQNNPDLIVYYNYFLDHSYTLVELPAEKFDPIKDKPIKVSLSNGKIDRKKLNVLSLGLQRNKETRLYYQVEGTSQVVAMLSDNEFMELYRNYLNHL